MESSPEHRGHHIKNYVPTLKTSDGSHNASVLRMVLYSHDTMGLGHIRRNLLIAQALAHSHLRVSIMMISGTCKASEFKLPPGVDFLTLPSLYKAIDGKYKSRNLAMTFREIIGLRAKIIRTAVEAFKPDAFIVDNVPRGVGKELNATLEYLRANGNTRCILGLRDVLDTPDAISREWGAAGNMDAIRNYYDAVWVYGDPSVHNLVKEHNFPSDIASKVCYTGYFDQRMRLKFRGVKNDEQTIAHECLQEEFMLCLVGGGQDGAELAKAFAKADFPSGIEGVLLTGPFMPSQVKERLRLLGVKRKGLHVLEFINEPTMLLNRARSVVTMGGYNSISEVLSFEKRALVVPRIKPRREQLIRAEQLHALGLVDVLYPEDVCPRALSVWLSDDTKTFSQASKRIDLNGLSRLPILLEEVLSISSTLSEVYRGGGIKNVVN